MTTGPKKPPSPGHAPLTVAEAQTGNDLLTIMGNVLASWQGVEHTIADIYLVSVRRVLESGESVVIQGR